MKQTQSTTSPCLPRQPRTTHACRRCTDALASSQWTARHRGASAHAIHRTPCLGNDLLPLHDTKRRAPRAHAAGPSRPFLRTPPCSPGRQLLLFSFLLQVEQSQAWVVRPPAAIAAAATEPLPSSRTVTAKTTLLLP
jgi:hypothetical protein